jgi:serine/threonine-protein kinase
VLLVFSVSFYLSMKGEMRSTQVVVPNLKGLPVEEVAAVVEPLGLTVEVADESHDPSVPSGRVLDQRPPEGSTVKRGRRVKLRVSLGGRVLAVPALAGKADRAATIELRRDGFAPGDEARIRSAAQPAGRILAQVPPAGSPGVPNTRVHRLVSDGPPTLRWVMPDLTGLPRGTAERWIADGGFRRGAVRTIGRRGARPGTVVGQSPLAGYPVEPKQVIELTVAR